MKHPQRVTVRGPALRPCVTSPTIHSPLSRTKTQRDFRPPLLPQREPAQSCPDASSRVLPLIQTYSSAVTHSHTTPPLETPLITILVTKKTMINQPTGGDCLPPAARLPHPGAQSPQSPHNHRQCEATSARVLARSAVRDAPAQAGALQVPPPTPTTSTYSPTPA